MSSLAVAPTSVSAGGDPAAAGDTAAPGAAAGAAGSGLSTLAQDVGTGAVLSTLISGGYLKYAGIWAGLAVLGVALILMGLRRNGVNVPRPPLVITP